MIFNVLDDVYVCLLLLAADGAGIEALLNLRNSFGKVREPGLEIVLIVLVLLAMLMLAVPVSKVFAAEYALVGPILPQVIVEVGYVLGSPIPLLLDRIQQICDENGLKCDKLIGFFLFAIE